MTSNTFSLSKTLLSFSLNLLSLYLLSCKLQTSLSPFISPSPHPLPFIPPPPCLTLPLPSFLPLLQACTEMLLPCSTNNVTDMFPPTVYDPSVHCRQVWGVDARPGWMKAEFWGKGQIFSCYNAYSWLINSLPTKVHWRLVCQLVILGGYCAPKCTQNCTQPSEVCL